MTRLVDEELWERSRHSDLEYLELAKAHGIYGPLADYVEADGPLHPETRAFLAKMLRGELPAKRPGRKRLPGKKLEDYRLARRILEMMGQGNLSRNAAIEAYCAETGIEKETVKTALSRAEPYINPFAK